MQSSEGPAPHTLNFRKFGGLVRKSSGRCARQPPCTQHTPPLSHRKRNCQRVASSKAARRPRSLRRKFGNLGWNSRGRCARWLTSTQHTPSQAPRGRCATHSSQGVHGVYSANLGTLVGIPRPGAPAGQQIPARCVLKGRGGSTKLTPQVWEPWLEFQGAVRPLANKYPTHTLPKRRADVAPDTLRKALVVYPWARPKATASNLF